MKKILLSGKLNGAVKEINAFLSKSFQVQLCTENATVFKGMLKIVQPDLVLISLIGSYDVDTAIFYELYSEHTDIPVLTIGTKEELEGFLKYYDSGQFENLIRPVENKEILAAICRRLELDVGELEQGMSQQPDAQQAEEASKKLVLVVDDNAVTLRTMKAMLQDHYEIALATSGTQAMTSIGKKRPDLILLDYEMPVCDGRMTLEMIRAEEELKDIPVIFLTGVNDREHIEAVLSLHPAGYFLKPANKEKLMEAIDKTMQG